MKTLRRLNSDLPALLDEWATSLFHELDYVREAENGVRFKKLYGELEVMSFSEFQVVRPLADVHPHLNSGPTLTHHGFGMGPFYICNRVKQPFTTHIHKHGQQWHVMTLLSLAAACLSAALFPGIVWPASFSFLT